MCFCPDAYPNRLFCVEMALKDSITSALYAGIIGDALGVPVECSTRQELALCSVKNMLGYGRYDQPEGTWSDDTSLVLCTMESLLDRYDPEDMGRTFCRWLFDSYWTPTGFVFDAGLTTYIALDKIQNGHGSALKSGGATEDDNGNGSLMRMLPAALFFAPLGVPEFLARVHEISAITHAHPRAKTGCGIYCLYIRELLGNPDKLSAYKNAVKQAVDYYSSQPEFSSELSHFMRILSYAVPGLPRSDIRSSGYIVDTLEAALWCVLTHSSTKDILLAAVNLGLDTDTTGMVAGGCAGLLYGLESVPREWLSALARKSELDGLIGNFTGAVCRRNAEEVMAR
jgi:ADP-ribosyl-[dinitrogen reductase] hydrolase